MKHTTTSEGTNNDNSLHNDSMDSNRDRILHSGDFQEMTTDETRSIMESKRKFYRAVVQYEILSEEPIDSMSLSDIEYETTEGHMSGQFLETKYEDLTGSEMAKALIGQGSDAEFFQLTETGEDIEDSEVSQ